MARADAAEASVQTELSRYLGLARAIVGRVARRGAAKRPIVAALAPADHAARAPGAGDWQRLLRWSVPAALLACLAALGCTLLGFTMAESRRVIASATTDVALIAAVIADDMDVRLREFPDQSPAEALRTALPIPALSRGQRVLLTDQAGQIVASYPPAAATGSIADQVGVAAPLTVFAEKAGVMRLTLLDGADALATVRSMHEPLGQLVVIHPLTDVLADWRAALTRTITLLAGTGLALVGLTFTYLRQVGRARRADTSCRMMRDRVDMVLSRGRCGLWDWDLASGSIEWSASMYEITGLRARSTALSIAEVGALIHPDDGGLDAMARVLAPGSSNAVDHTFRIRHAKGDWVWLRAKAELVQGEAGPPPRRHRHRHFRNHGSGGTDRAGGHAIARRNRDDLGSLRRLGRRQPPRHVQLQVPALP